MIRLVDPNQEHTFIPECEMSEKNPTTFHVRPMTMRQSIMVAQAARNIGGDKEIPIDAITELLTDNIGQIENGPNGIDDPKDFLDACSTPEGIGIVFELFKFIQELSAPTEAEAGN